MTSDRPGTAPRRHRQSAITIGLAIAAGIVAFKQVTRLRRRTETAGKTVVITGGSRGLGLILARKLARSGARVCIIARNSSELVAARGNVLCGNRPEALEVHTVVADVSDQSSIQEGMREAARLFGCPVDILINNAGLIQVGPMDVMTDEDYEEAMRTHFWGPYYAIQEVLPSMRRRGAGRIVNIASIGGKISVPHLLPYSASKFALVGLSEGLRSELLKDNIFVTTVCPGLIRTGSPRNAYFKGQHRDEYTWFALSDSIPVLSMSADRCADQIIDAMCAGDAEIVTSLVGQAAALVHGVAPSFVIDLLGLINRLLPSAGDSGTERYRGHESESTVTQSPLMRLTHAAEKANNQR